MSPSGLPDDQDLAELQKARLLWAHQRWDQAEAEFVRIAEAHPGNWRALVDVARVLGDRQQIRRSREWLDRLSILAADRADLRLAVAQTCRMSRREEEAIEWLKRHVSEGDGRRDPVAHLELAVLHERRHALEEADRSAQAALKAAPHWLEALIILARVRRQRGESVRAEAALQRILRAPAVHDGTRSQAWAMWADMADRAGQADLAMERLERAKALMRPAAIGLADHGLRVLRAWERVCRGVSSETLARWQGVEGGEPGRPLPAHLLGFPRSGTTLLENILEAHSGVVSSEESQVLGRDLIGLVWREPHEDTPPTVAALDAAPEPKLGALRQRYWDRMAEGLGISEDWPPVHLDKNPTHTLFIPAILRLLPDSRFLVALRDPRDVVVSCYFQWFPLNPNSASFLSWQQTIDRYLLDMGAWLDLRDRLPSDCWIEVRYEDVVDDFAGQARRSLEFLGLPWEDSVLAYRDRLVTKAVHTPSYLEIQRPVHRGAVGRWQKYARWMEPHLQRLRPMVEAFGYRW